MNFLQLCQNLHLKRGAGSGEQPGTLPSAVTSQNGKLLQIVTAIQEAWEDIQSEREDWLWMRREGTFTLNTGERSATLTTAETKAVASITRSGSTATATFSTDHGLYTGESVVIAGAVETDYNGTFTITAPTATTITYTVSGTPSTPATGTITATRTLPLKRVISYVAASCDQYLLVRDVAGGASTEQPMYYVTPQEWEGYFNRASYVSTGRPTFFTLLPSQQIGVFPAPNVPFRARFNYRKTHQALAANGDTPEMPAEYHRLIVDKALTYLSANEENKRQFDTAMMRYERMMDDLIAVQTPKIGWYGSP